MKYLGPISNPKDLVNKEYVDNQSGGGDHVELTQAEYDALSQAEKTNGTVYFITDGVPEYTVINDSVPIGAIQSYAGASCPYGWLMCDGAAVSRETYSELFSAIGTAYGSGDGSTTFNLPDLRGRVVVGVGNSGATGSTNHTLGQKAGKESAPEHKHDLLGTGVALIGNYSDTIAFNNANVSDDYIWNKWTSLTGGISYSWTHNSDTGVTESTPHYNEGRAINLAGSTGNIVTSSSDDTNMQPYLVGNYIIKALNTVSSSALEELDPQHILFDMFYPVGSYYETSDATFNPNVQWRGTWVSETKKNDYIVEEGTIDIWTYRKWASGVAECWGKTSITRSYAGWGNITYGSGTDPYYAYPSGLFIDEPTLSEVLSKTDGPWSWAMLANGSKDNTPALCPASTSGTSTNSYKIYIQAKGLWKTYSAQSSKTIWHRTA